MSEMTADELIREIFRVQYKHDPHTDPGDITIDIQDDMPMILVYQNTRWVQRPPSAGHTIQEALEKHLESIKKEISDE